MSLFTEFPQTEKRLDIKVRTVTTSLKRKKDRLQNEGKGAKVLIILLLCLLVFLILLSICVGKYSLSIADSAYIVFAKIFNLEQTWTSVAEGVVIYLRLPRVLAAGLVGGALSMSGASFQGIFKNPLVSPDLLGVSSGACIGAAIAILLGAGAMTMQMSAFIAGIITVLITLMIPRLIKSDSNIILVLSGIIVGGMMGSILGFIKYVADPLTQLAAITYWQMGSFAYISYQSLVSVLPPMIIGFVCLFAMSWWIDVLSLGDEEAKLLGANIRLLRTIVILAATLLTASAICISGTVGWIGLVIPHFARMFVGPNNQRLLPVSALIGAIFLIVIDTITRTLTTAELPISILTGLIGAPFYVFLLYRQRMRLQ